MTYLERQQTQTLKRNLLRARDRALAEAHDDRARVTGHPFRELAGEVPDVADEAVATELADFDNAMLERDLDRVRDIDAALARIADRRYGACSDCGDEIGYARLAVAPTATRCVACQAQRERTYRCASHPTL